jgi:hypothetical protein
MPKKAQAARSADEGDALAAWVILQDPVKYEGLPVMWAELWTQKHGAARKPPVKAERTIEDRAGGA